MGTCEFFGLPWCCTYKNLSYKSFVVIRIFLIPALKALPSTHTSLKKAYQNILLKKEKQVRIYRSGLNKPPLCHSKIRGTPGGFEEREPLKHLISFQINLTRS